MSNVTPSTPKFQLGSTVQDGSKWCTYVLTLRENGVWGLYATSVALTKEESINNAKLIAAAPELLEALKKVEQWIAEDSVSPTMHLSTIREKFIRPAILKATS